MMNSGKTFGLPAILLGSAMGLSAFAQTSTPPAQTTDSTAAPSTPTSGGRVTQAEAVSILLEALWPFATSYTVADNPTADDDSCMGTHHAWLVALRNAWVRSSRGAPITSLGGPCSTM